MTPLHGIACFYDVGFGARAVSRKTPIYFINFIKNRLFQEGVPNAALASFNLSRVGISVICVLNEQCSYICQHLIKMCFMLFLAGWVHAGRFSEAGSARCSLVEAQLLDAFRPGTTCNPIGLEAFSKERDFVVVVESL